MPGEMDLTGGLGILPSNELFAPTEIDGKGTSEFDVWTTTLNPDLGCTYHVSCALVAVPIMGISCDPAAKGMPFIDRPTPGVQEQQAAAACEEKYDRSESPGVDEKLNRSMVISKSKSLSRD